MEENIKKVKLYVVSGGVCETYSNYREAELLNRMDIIYHFSFKHHKFAFNIHIFKRILIKEYKYFLYFYLLPNICLTRNGIEMRLLQAKASHPSLTVNGYTDKRPTGTNLLMRQRC